MARKDRHTSSEVGPGGWQRSEVAREGGRVERSSARSHRTRDGATSFFLNPFGWGPGAGGGRASGDSPGTDSFLKGLILAQNERWRRGLGMQVERAARPVAEG